MTKAVPFTSAQREAIRLAERSSKYLEELAKFDTGKMAGTDRGRGYNQSTASGLPLWVMDPRPDDIRIYDIAAQLSRICRFGGALRDDVEIYTVAQHCCLVSDHLPPALRLEGLLHDAHEYAIGDKLKPLKMNLATLDGGAWKELEHHFEVAVRRRFGLPDKMTPAVKEQDYIAVATEHRQLQTITGQVDWGTLPPPWPETIEPWGVMRARDEFLDRFYLLYKGE